MLSTIEGCLGYLEAKSIKLAGQEFVDGVPTWHVQVVSKYDERLEFWLDLARPTQVLKHAKNGSDVAISRYSDDSTGRSIPTEVTSLEYHNGAPFFARRFVRSNAQFNLRIDPASWTLAGLGLPIGTDVSDSRIHRRIGYWTGSGLSENLPNKAAEAPAPPNMAELLETLETTPASASALEAASWILLNTPDGPEVEQAGQVILREHSRDTNLVSLCEGLGRLRPRCITNLLEAILQNNPQAEARATACFILAGLQKEAAAFGQNKRATAEADKLFDRVITEFAGAGRVGADLAGRAKPELYELRRLTLGQLAPETSGEDQDGNKLDLSDYRGKVVMVAFWCCGYSEATEHRQLLEQMNGKPFELIGVTDVGVSERRRVEAKAAMAKQEVTWPCFFDKGLSKTRLGPIHDKWNAHKWLTTILLDRNGIIRYRDLRGRELNDALDALLRE
jgi:peroxiredoxin